MAETQREALRRELPKLDGPSLSHAVEAAMVEDRDTGLQRPTIVGDAAQRVSSDYAVAADQLDKARQDLAYSEKAIETHGKQRDHVLDQGDERWRRMGTLARYGHRTGVRPDPEMSRQEQAEKGAAERLAAEEKRRARRVPALPDLERQEGEALEAVRPQADQARAAAGASGLCARSAGRENSGTAGGCPAPGPRAHAESGQEPRPEYRTIEEAVHG